MIDDSLPEEEDLALGASGVVNELLVASIDDPSSIGLVVVVVVVRLVRVE